MLNPSGAAVLGLNCVVLLALLVVPLRRRGRQDDEGDGVDQVILPKPPRPVHAVRVFSFFVIGIVVSLLLVWFEPQLTAAYRRLLFDLASWALTQPQNAGTIVIRADPSLTFLAATYFVCFALTVRASPARRLRMLLNVPLFLGLVLALDTLLTVAAATTGWPLVPGSVIEAVLILALGFLVFVRTMFVSFMLPRPTRQKKTRRFNPREALIMGVAICAGLGAVTMLATAIGQPGIKGQATQIILALFIFSCFFTTVILVLVLARLMGPADPSYLDPPPPVDVLVAAFNEEEMITSNLEAIDLAAQVYGGPVHVIVIDDGSTDRTAEVAQAVMSRFQTASGEVLQRTNGGVARAYNSGIVHATSEYIVRVDCDTLIDPEALANVVRWFPDPSVGLVSAMYLPRTDLPQSWFHRGRLMECLFGSGYSRWGYHVVDGVILAEGPLMAFRRSVIMSIGGYTTGLNGEDLDIALKIGRAGYRIVLDNKVIAHEDCPRTLTEFRKQRNRWSRAGVHCFSRYSPFSSGLSGPRTWFSYPRLFSNRFYGPLRILVLLHAIGVAIFRPDYRYTLLIVVALYLASSLPQLAIGCVLMVRYGLAKRLPWVLVWYPFLLTRRFAQLEGLLSLPTRPVEVRAAIGRVSSSVRVQLASGGYSPGGEPA
ncbi:MAG: glycosyltransferase [Acidimicrobiales bacterium]